VPICDGGQVNCGPACYTDGRTDDAAAIGDEAHGIRGMNYWDASLTGRRSLSSAGQQPVRRGLGDPARRRRVRWWRSVRGRALTTRARPMD